MTAKLFAALLDGVPRYRHEHLGVMVQTKTDIGVWFFVDQVLAALAAAVPDDLAEAGKVMELLSIKGQQEDEAPNHYVRRMEIDRIQARNVITALLARIAAQEAQIKGLEAELHTMKTAGVIEVAVRNPSVFDYMQHWEGRAEAAETALAAMTKERDEAQAYAELLLKAHEAAIHQRDIQIAYLAAERAKVAKLVEAGKALQADMLERARIGRDAIHGEEYRIVNAGRTAWADFCAAITEASQ